MTTKHKPATPLPWTREKVARARGEVTREENAQYGVHAGNAYPKLVEALRYCVNVMTDTTCNESPTDRAKRVLAALLGVAAPVIVIDPTRRPA